MWPPHIFDLPTETKLVIFSYLPFKEIQRARVLCRHIRDLIDHDTNRTITLKSTWPIEVLAIKEVYSDLFEFDPQKTDILKFTNFVFKLRQSAHYTGSQLERQESFHNTCDIIAALWVRRTTVFFKPDVKSDIRNLIYKLVQLHNFYASPEYHGRTCFVDNNLNERHFAAEAQYGRSQLSEWYDRLTDPDCIYLAFDDFHNTRPGCFSERRKKFILSTSEASNFGLPVIPGDMRKSIVYAI